MTNKKKLAHEYSKKFRDKKTVAPNPQLALAFEAGWNACRKEVANKLAHTAGQLLGARTSIERRIFEEELLRAIKDYRGEK